MNSSRSKEMEPPARSISESKSPATKAKSKQGGKFLVSVMRVTVDAVLIYLAFALAWYIRYQTDFGPEVAEQNYVDLNSYMWVQVGTVAVIMAVFLLNGLYRHRVGASWFDEVSSISSGAIIGVAIMIVIVFYWQPLALSRLMFIYTLVCIIVILSLVRLLENILRAQLRKRGIGMESVLVVGAGSLGRLMLQNIMAKSDLGFKCVGFVDKERTEDIGRFRALGKPSDIARLITEYDLSQVIIALPSTQHREISDILVKCRRGGVDFRIVPDFYELSLRQVDITEINGIPLIGLKELSMRRRELATKRAVDVTLSLGILTILSPIIALCALAIKLDSKGPIIFEQIRLGRDGKPFKAYKFRSMKQNAEAELDKLRQFNEVDGPIFKMKEDPRITRVGRWLRKLSLDELPQFYNVLKGDMSFVGPRPPIPAEVENYEDWHRKRLDTRPGLTGLWQVSGRSNLGFDEMVLLDLYYIENWSLALDFKIILKTIPAVLMTSGAY